MLLFFYLIGILCDKPAQDSRIAQYPANVSVLQQCCFAGRWISNLSYNVFATADWFQYRKSVISFSINFSIK